MRIQNAADNIIDIPRQPVINNALKNGFRRNRADELEDHNKAASADIEYKNDALEKIIGDLNKKINIAGRELVRSIHEKTGQVMVKVVDTDTGETVREIPHEKSLDMLAKILEQSGLLLDKKT